MVRFFTFWPGFTRVSFCGGLVEAIDTFSSLLAALPELGFTLSVFSFSLDWFPASGTMGILSGRGFTAPFARVFPGLFPFSLAYLFR